LYAVLNLRGRKRGEGRKNREGGRNVGRREGGEGRKEGKGVSWIPTFILQSLINTRIV
jgi:hypothetical protein